MSLDCSADRPQRRSGRKSLISSPPPQLPAPIIPVPSLSAFCPDHSATVKSLLYGINTQISRIWECGKLC